MTAIEEVTNPGEGRLLKLIAKLDSNDLRRAREANTFSAGRGMFRRIPPQRKHKMTQDLLGRPFGRKNGKRVLKSQLQGSCLQVHRRM